MSTEAAVGTSALTVLDGKVSCLLCGQYVTDVECLEECGHSFCRGCCTQIREKKRETGPEACYCPRCEEVSLKRKLTPDLELEKIVEKRAKMVMNVVEAEKMMCATHQLPLIHFYQRTRQQMCYGCIEEEHEGEEEASEEEESEEEDSESVCPRLPGYLTKELDVNWAEVTLDPDTADPCFRVSADRKKLSWSSDSLNLADYSQRFSRSSCVLGCEGFTSGRHYWVVEVGPTMMADWAVGVARESMERKENMSLSNLPEGIWSFSYQYGGNLISQKIGIYLDYEGNRVKFFNADNNEGTVLHTFSSAPFEQEKIRPFFMLSYSSSFSIPTKLRICK